MLNSIGWVATGIFAVSYFVKRSDRMRLVQAVAALCWIVDGVLLHATPIIVANVIVASLAGYSALRVSISSQQQAAAALGDQLA